MNNTSDTQYFTAKEFAKIIRVSVKTLYNKVYEGELEPSRLFSNRGPYRFTQKDLEEYNKTNHRSKKCKPKKK
ncbi:hypothetical protein BMS_0752 [Halobacteriovorax marinus SJ]|uniref:Helix-turn-helix domain-containing protein n=1 Tax=Halobacteriovorax marinus (strain ATCC BAA-682 / DSM 15412 / SJ) TaxID=862908 RepID=E1X5T8_HALMS|nr:helix-turn-helix domain-containing protein [Halobacteriovorax marinus]CBW25655.1 hypothetical protein BMS_0752 [Halobacteriovorax marinus SJ]